MKLNLQTFAENDEIVYPEPEMMTGEGDDNPDKAKTPNEEEPKFTDTLEKDKTTQGKKNEVVESDSEAKSDKETDKANDGSSNEEKTDKPKQSKEQNEFYANKRREEKALKEQLELARQEGKTQALLESVNHINPFTKKEIKDQVDIDEYLTMLDIQKLGKDPVEDYLSYQKDLKRQELQKVESQKANEEFIANDIKEFDTKFPSVNRTELVSPTSRFTKFAGSRLGKEPLASLYQSYLDFTGEISQDATLKAQAKTLSTPNELKKAKAPDDVYSLEEIKRLSRAEINKNWEKVERSYKKLHISL